uniref:mRNA export factor GLE1 n=1 Tax=Chromera velia CCMP2878 TaxID=1169474 RepID=A0A0G4HHT1_9ALVE|eukprot:Cvel_6862.t1-p1 / transcript=Cvel_6862.t1 / gene=Cvel_6862 / organism=Chromera_velia_CCMP2878 / gene_product=Nucleoporin GLE1, putative / transcript_product=Nucleoporin GLE1, putative / location=Cvel_scaffold346:86308-96293(-) / protein_length=690 / sequence_SO=supercontig / SO=protein_coding / is_pseudo=false
MSDPLSNIENDLGVGPRRVRASFRRSYQRGRDQSDEDEQAAVRRRAHRSPAAPVLSEDLRKYKEANKSEGKLNSFGVPQEHHNLENVDRLPRVGAEQGGRCVRPYRPARASAPVSRQAAQISSASSSSAAVGPGFHRTPVPVQSREASGSPSLIPHVGGVEGVAVGMGGSAAREDSRSPAGLSPPRGGAGRVPGYPGGVQPEGGGGVQEHEEASRGLRIRRSLNSLQRTLQDEHARAAARERRVTSPERGVTRTLRANLESMIAEANSTEESVRQENERYCRDSQRAATRITEQRRQAERRSQEERRAAEQKRKEDEDARAREEAERKRKEEEEARRRQEEAAKKSEEERQTQERERQTKEREDANRQALERSRHAARTAYKYVIDARELVKKLEKFEEEDVKSFEQADPSSKRDARRKVSTPINTISGVTSQVEGAINSINIAMAQFKRENQMKYLFAAYRMGEHVFSVTESQVKVQTKMAWAYGATMAEVIKRNMEAEWLLLGQWFKLCPYCVPDYAAQREGESDEAWNKRRNWNPGESEESFMLKQSAYIRVYFAYLVQLQAYDRIWAWFARVLNKPRQAQTRILPALLFAALEVSGFFLWGMFKEHFGKILVIINTHIKNICEEKERTRAEVIGPFNKKLFYFMDKAAQRPNKTDPMNWRFEIPEGFQMKSTASHDVEEMFRASGG